MPQHRNEPQIYSGSVLMMMGNQIGELVQTPYQVAQGLVMNGQARWEGDESPMPRHIADIIAKRQAERDAQVAADAAHGEAMKQERAGLIDPPPQVRELDIPAGQLYLAQIVPAGDAAPLLYLARPFPQTAEFEVELFAEDADKRISRDGAAIALKLENASAVYSVIAENDDFAVASLVEKDAPDVEIPDNWRDEHFLKNVSRAKKIRRLDNSASLSKDEAYAIIEEWRKTDVDLGPVPVRAEGAPAVDKGVNEAGRKLDGNHEGNEAVGKDGERNLSPEEAAKQREQEFAAGDDGFDG